MMYVTDTQPLVYHITGRRNRLARRALAIYDRVKTGRDSLLVPFTVLEELLLLSEGGKIRLNLPFRDFVISLRQADNFELAINDTNLILEAASFSTIRDPYDRLIIAQARVAGSPLITGDTVVLESGLVRTVWD